MTDPDTEFAVVTYADDETESDAVERERLVEEYGATGDELFGVYAPSWGRC